MSVNLTRWPPAVGPQADVFQALCARAARQLSAASVKETAARLGNPRALHQQVYGAVLPDSLQHVAGAYRGSAHPDLANLIVAYAFTETEGTDILALPQKVGQLMFAYGGLVRRLLATPALSAEGCVKSAARLMAAFGYIHPFWDGNGHIQRLTFETLLARNRIAMNASWSIHPCPYGVETHRALAARNPAKIAAAMLRFVAA